MHDRVLKRMREAIRSLEYVMTLHAEEEMADHGFLVLDVEEAFLAGEIVERQRDAATGEAKYLICGRSVEQREIMVAAKFGPTGRLVIITVYANEE